MKHVNQEKDREQAMSKKLILGISGSPRKGANLDYLLDVALKEAEQAEDIRTEIIHLRDYKIESCNSCFACCRDGAVGSDRACLSFKDDMDLIYPKLAECSGLILGSPVFFGNVTAQMKTFMDRTEALLRYSKSKWQYALSNKVAGGLVVGGNRNAGQEFTLQALHYFYFIHNMIVVGSGPDLTPGCYLGGAATTFPEKGDVRNAVAKDELGLKSTRMLGRRVAEVVNLLKDGKDISNHE